MRIQLIGTIALMATCMLCAWVVAAQDPPASPRPASAAGNIDPTPSHVERPDDRQLPSSSPETADAMRGARSYTRGSFESIQVNVNANGLNIVGDAANEPSIAVDPTQPRRIAIGWRQFDNVVSNFRQAGQGYSGDGGHTWTFPGVLRPGEFGSDPVLDFDAEGNFYYYSLQPDRGPGDWACYLYKSDDGGVTYPFDTYAFGGDKAWIAIDRTGGIGHGHIYTAWSSNFSCCGTSDFARSIDGGLTFERPIDPGISARWGTVTVGPGGEVYVASMGSGFVVSRSLSASDPNARPTFDLVRVVSLAGAPDSHRGPNPGGLLGQAWVATDHSDTATHGNVYLLASVNPPGGDPLDVMFARSGDGGVTWSTPVRVNDDPTDNAAWQWFGTMSVAPTGRIDVIWNDTRSDPGGLISELYYSFSNDAGGTWSPNVAVSLPFDPTLGYPNQEKIGDYYDMVSDRLGVNVAYAATFNGEQDVYFLRIGPYDCNGNLIDDETDIADGTSDDCDGNGIPDECDPDCNNNQIADGCDIASEFSGDCSDNGIPDECEPDCNENQIADSCDIVSGFSDDCNSNGTPDECDADCDGDGIPSDCDDSEDSDGDGLDDCVDACPFTAPPTPCVCPALGRCCFGTLCLEGYPRVSCIEGGGTPDCTESPCHRGCLEGDADLDGDLDLTDVAALLLCFTGPREAPGYIPPTAECLDAFDHDSDVDVDLLDFEWFRQTLTQQ